MQGWLLRTSSSSRFRLLRTTCNKGEMCELLKVHRSFPRPRKRYRIFSRILFQRVRSTLSHLRPLLLKITRSTCVHIDSLVFLGLGPVSTINSRLVKSTRSLFGIRVRCTPFLLILIHRPIGSKKVFLKWYLSSQVKGTPPP
ncbi:hypothetical protein FA15DRAFT_406139 [Coprinopsis marcescibilis]|uniref:Uncharacterized protein n=1 Tax=Coprinopsis marcescibilis TaxID=230819 RepID=A0A5C3KVM6_COPMA|nr:hypothetical protein FA15DRAFT_406139 [Coprinopsis marcescibilis]